MFDPAGSPHYEVVLIPAVPNEPLRRPKVKKKGRGLDEPFCLDFLFSSPDDTLLLHEQTKDGEEFQPVVDEDEDEDKEPDDPHRLMEWPPSPWQLDVFSSRTGQWEVRSFIREGKPAGTVEDIRLDLLERSVRRCYTVYQNIALYVHCRGSFIMRYACIA
jgi:hypothetical protein